MNGNKDNKLCEEYLKVFFQLLRKGIRPYLNHRCSCFRTICTIYKEYFRSEIDDLNNTIYDLVTGTITADDLIYKEKGIGKGMRDTEVASPSSLDEEDQPTPFRKQLNY